MVTFIAPLNGTGYGVAARHMGRALHQIYGDSFRYEVISKLHLNDLCYLDQGILDSIEKPVNYDDDVIVFWHMFDCAKYVEKYKGKKSLYTTFELNKLSNIEVSQLRYFDEICTASSWGRDVISLNHPGTPKVIRHAPYGEPLHSAYTDKQAIEEYYNSYYSGNRLPYINQLIECLGYDPAVTNIYSSSGKYEVRKSQKEILIELNNQTLYNPGDKYILVASWYNPFIVGGYNFSDFNMLGLKQKQIVLPDDYIQYIDAVYTNQNNNFTLVLLKKDIDYYNYHKLLHADAYIAPSKAEGWNLNLSNMIANTLVPCFATNVTGHSEYHETFYPIPVSGSIVVKDDMFFKNNNNSTWYSPKKIILDDMYYDHMIVFKDQFIKIKQIAIDFFKNVTWQNEAKKFLQ